MVSLLIIPRVVKNVRLPGFLVFADIVQNELSIFLNNELMTLTGGNPIKYTDFKAKMMASFIKPEEYDAMCKNTK